MSPLKPLDDRNCESFNLQVLAGGTLEIGSVTNPHRGFAEIVFKDEPFDSQIDPGQYGHGLIAFGIVRMHGLALEQTFAPVAGEILSGQQSLALTGNVVDWRPGDQVLVPDTRQLFYTADVISGLNRYETTSVLSSSNNGVELSQPLEYDHLGARGADGELVFLAFRR